MLQSFATRMFVLAALSLTVFGIGKVANIIDPPASDGRSIPFTDTQLAAPLSDPTMARAFAELEARHGTSGGGMGARMTFRGPSGSVTLHASEVYDLNQRYRRMAAHEARMAEHEVRMEDLQRENLDLDGWGSDTGY